MEHGFTFHLVTLKMTETRKGERSFSSEGSDKIEKTLPWFLCFRDFQCNKINRNTVIPLRIERNGSFEWCF